FIDDPHVGLADVALLPATLLFVTEDMTSDGAFAGQRERLEGLSVGDLLARGESAVKDISSTSVSVEYAGGHTFMLELMRADFNGDGIQDLLIHRGCGPIGGTYRSGSVLAITRSSSEAMFTTAPVGASKS